MANFIKNEKQGLRNTKLTMIDGLHTGQVKWFNRRRGYVFNKILKSENSEEDFIGKDVFVHQSHITPKKSTYRSLEENEYVDFSLSLDDRNTTQAVNVTGIMNGTLLCDAYVDKKNNFNFPSEGITEIE